MDINKLLVDKEAALAHARQQVALLEKQVTSLRETLGMLSPTEYEKFLSNKIEAVVTDVDSAIETAHSGKTLRRRNKKGSVQKILLEIITNENQTLDQIGAQVNAKTSKPVSPSVLRTHLWIMKSEGRVTSDKPGQYRLP